VNVTCGMEGEFAELELNCTRLLSLWSMGASELGYTNQSAPPTTMTTMRCFFTFLLLALVGVVRAVSTKGNRVLVVLEDSSEKDNYSKFWGDLEGALGSRNCWMVNFICMVYSRVNFLGGC
jgi:hypothetical protein